MPAALEILNDLRVEPRLDVDDTRLGRPGIERAREVGRVEGRRVDRRLEVQPVDGVGEEEGQRPLVLLVASGRSEGEVGLAVAERERG